MTPQQNAQRSIMTPQQNAQRSIMTPQQNAKSWRVVCHLCRSKPSGQQGWRHCT